MPGSPDRSPTETILEFLDSTRGEPFTAPEIASETGHSLQTIREELPALVERGLLESKTIAGSEAVWRPARGKHGGGEQAGRDAPVTDATGGQPSRRRLMEQHRELAQFVTRIDISEDLDDLLALITEEARELVGAHQSVTSRTINQNWEQAINAVSMSDKYAEYRDYDTEPDGSGIYTLVCETNEPMRLTQAELESHPAWEAFGDHADEHPPMRGWLAVPIVGPDGQNRGLIQLSDKYQGEFTQADEAILVQLANVASAAIENGRLYDELEESEKRYRTLFDSMTEGYCVVETVDTPPGDPTDFRYVGANPAFEQHTGLQDVVGETVRESVPGRSQEWVDVYERVARTRGEVRFERELESDGRVLQCRAFPIGDAPTRQVGMTVRDVTERVERERRLKASNQRLESFTSMLAHELRNPVAIGQIYCQQLPEETDSKAVTHVAEALDRVENMIDVMLVVAQGRTAVGDREPVALAETARDAWRAVRTHDATLVVDVDARIRGEETYVQHLFRNLFENAVQHGGPDVTVRVEGTPDGFLVADDGEGIPPEDRDEVFKVGMTTADGEGGTGLGLAFVQQLARVYDWSCELTESAAGGAKFEFGNVDVVDTDA